jgi:phosphomannomutase
MTLTCFKAYDIQGKLGSEFIEGYYIVGLLAAAFLARHPGEKIIHDPRLTWNTIDIVKTAGGKRLSELVAERIAAYPCSGEINHQATDAQAAMERVREHYANQ